MSLFEDENIDVIDDMSEDENVYLDNPKKGIELIKRMLLRKQGKNVRSEFDNHISNKIFPILTDLELENEMEIYEFLTKMSGKMEEIQKVNLLEGKKVLGIGGQFSAGKSCFINSISNANLPEGQRPTTSIATYIVNAESRKNLAITVHDNTIELDDQAMSAITHKFFDQYQIGFSKLIKNLVVHTPNFTYPNIAILDTPGYSKSDMSKKDDNKDKGMAQRQLNTVDYLIWLVDSDNGGIKEGDIEIISSLNVNSDILVVFTKASLKTKDQLKQIVQGAKNTLNNISKKIYDVIAYDSFDKETIIGGDTLEQFLQMINDTNADSKDIKKQICNMREQLECQIENRSERLQEEIEEIEGLLTRTSNVEHISALISEYSRCKSIATTLTKTGEKAVNTLEELEFITDLMKRGKLK